MLYPFFTSIPFICFVITTGIICIFITYKRLNGISLSLFLGFFSSLVINTLFWLIIVFGILTNLYQEKTTRSLKYDLVSFTTKSYNYAEGGAVCLFPFFVGSYKEGSTPYYYYYMRTIDGIKFCKDQMDDDSVFLNETDDGSAYVEQIWTKISSPKWLIDFYGFSNDSQHYKIKTVINFPKGTIKREFDTSLKNL